MESSAITQPPREVDSRADRFALSVLALTILVSCLLTWQCWGDLTIDCGREMMVPAAILQGKRLYFDLWYPYGPAIPYWHALLFRIFGVHLNVLYAAGIGLTLLITWFTYRIARVFLPPPLSFAPAFAVAISAFCPGLFNLILPYSYPAVYGAAFSVIVVWLLIQWLQPVGETWRLAVAGLLSGLTMATKTEFGMAILGVLACAILLKAWIRGTGRWLMRDILTVAPGPLGAAGVFVWLVRHGSFPLIFEENIPLTASAYFVRTLGKRWLQITGFPVSGKTFLVHLGVSAAGTAFLCLSLYWLSRGAGARLRAIYLGGIAAMCAYGAWAEIFHGPGHFAQKVVTGLLFTSAMPLICGILLIWSAQRLITRQDMVPAATAFLLAAASIAISMRSLLNIRPAAYGLYYMSCPYIGWLVTMTLLSGGVSRRRAWWTTATRTVGAALCLGAVGITAPSYAQILHRAGAAASDRGTVKTDSAKAAAYGQALAFLKEASARSERWVTLPEDVSLYFFTGTTPPSRYYAITPGILEPGRRTAEYLADLEREKVRYVLLSDRGGSEYGTPVFGVDWGQEIFAWVERNFEPVRQIGEWGRGWAVRIYRRRGTASAASAGTNQPM